MDRTLSLGSGGTRANLGGDGACGSTAGRRAHGVVGIGVRVAVGHLALACDAASLFVPAHVGIHRETAATVFAGVRFLAGVGQHMCAELARAFKALVATSALVFFVALSPTARRADLDRGAEQRRQGLFVSRVVHRRKGNQGRERAAGGHGGRSGRREVVGEAVGKLVLGLEGSKAKEIEGSGGGH